MPTQPLRHGGGVLEGDFFLRRAVGLNSEFPFVYSGCILSNVYGKWIQKLSHNQ